ncbi:hypothetical protein MYSEV_080 [Mythimna separata entomopoxvirus 'L']|uniref:C2H2-type domain-containing protein n=1 Tax=Mythimna separata entomopoxvirus 'L' TaxID=1293572 RepID=A0A916KQ17_9POXV|nr:hypothetical protein MYSEV_080 [Mythimna separata entomopoxvirus 'L']CCU56278.1 hypothetical protein MYSEV_080 [Mythimna separata entomopoxvirus 'L']
MENKFNDINKCYLCDDIYYNTRLELLTHIRDKHLQSYNDYDDILEIEVYNRPTNECYICNKTFTSKSNLNRHIKNLHDINNIKCKYCDLEFINKFNLKLHTNQAHSNNNKNHKYDKFISKTDIDKLKNIKI